MEIKIRKLQKEDAEMISKAFAEMGWNKPVSQYAKYYEDQSKGSRIVLLAFCDMEFAGYLTIKWLPDYPYYKENNIPEIQDLNVLLKFRRKGIATKLMDQAEEIIGERSSIVGIGVGLHSGYNAAQRMYVLRGYVPDGKGVTYDDEFIKEGQVVTADYKLVLHFVKSLPQSGKRTSNLDQVDSDPGLQCFMQSGQQDNFLMTESRAPMKVLQSNRICLRAIDMKDLKPLWKLMYGEKESEWSNWDGPYYGFKQAPFEDFCRKMEDATNKEHPSRVIMEFQEKIIGKVSYYWEHEQMRWLEVGIDIYDSSYWNRGLGVEALTLWISHLFGIFEVERIGLSTWSGNVRMMRCAEKLGMRLEGRIRRCRYDQGHYYDSIWYGVLREEWQPND